LEREIKYSLPYDKVALMDFIFYQKNQSEFRINHVIKDVVPGRVTELLRQSFQYAAKAETLFGKDQAWRLDLTEIYKLIPLNQGKRAAEHKKLLYIYEALFSRRRIRYDFLILQFVLLAEIYHTKSFEGTSIKAQAGFEEISLVDSMLRANLFLIFLKNEKLLEGEMSLNGMTEFEGMDNEMQVYLMEMKYGEPAAALFLLGYLMNQIGKEQSETGYKQKPVLEKINFSGMFWGKVAQLTNTVFNQLKHYDVLRYNERTFAAMKLLMDKHRDSWGLSPQENVFFILSGYAYATRAAIKGAKKKVNNNQMEETNNE
jgi:CRISPR-associated protein Csh1